MGTVRFIHCADLHLDTPFRGLSQVDEARGKALNAATFQSLANIVDAAIRNEVDFVVIAGDVYDSADRSVSAQFRFKRAIQCLTDRGIDVFIACGNHDPLNGWSATIEWPKHVHTFAGDRVDIRQVTRNGNPIATLYGISYEKEATRENLAARFPQPETDLPSIAVLHANVGGDTAHLPYAPTTVEELASKGYDYWALGHVHTHRILRAEAPAIVYPGCSQSRHPNETGAKGCCLVTLNEAYPPDIRFIATDIVRYDQTVLDISDCDSQDAVRQAIVGECHAIIRRSEGRHIVVRITLTGRTGLHRELTRSGSLDALLQVVREDLEGEQPWAWVERLIPDTRGSYSLEEQRGREDFVGDLVSAYDTLLDPNSGLLQERSAELEAVLSSWQGYRFLKDPISGETITQEEMAALADQARRMTLDQLVEDI